MGGRRLVRATSRRPPTHEVDELLRRARSPRPPRARPRAGRGSAGTARSPIELAGLVAALRAISSCPSQRDAGSWCSRTAAAAAATARATGTSPRSLNARRLRDAAARPAHARRGARPRATSSTSTLLAERLVAATRWAQATGRARRRCRSATSAPAPAPPRRCGRPPTPASVSARSSRAAGGPTSPPRACPRSPRPCC